jgi:hypothetical protein
MRKKNLYLALMLLTLLVAYFAYHLSGYFFYDMLSPLIEIVTILFFIVIIVVAFFRKKQKYIIVASSFCIGLTLFFPFIREKVYSKELDVNMTNANEVIRAINKFRGDNDSFPVSLKELSPKYVGAIKPVNSFLRKKVFNYFRYDSYYKLYFKTFGGNMQVFDSKRGRWELAD